MTLTEIILFSFLLVANAFEIIGFNRACWYDEDGKMILWRVKHWGDTHLGEFWSKPFYACPTCMASVHGVIPFWIVWMGMYSFSPVSVAVWAFYTLTLSGVVTLLNR